METIIRNWPGKGADDSGVEHPAVLHMLDVAAVAERLVPPLPLPLRQTLLLLAALHDLGKIGLSYRTMLRTKAPQVAGRHWEITEAFLRHHDALLETILGGTWKTRYELYAASAGHHGRPPTRDLQGDATSRSGDWQRMLDAAGPQAIADAAAVIQAFAALWPGASLDGMTLAEAKALSWQLAGWITAADWIGSNPRWFPPEAGAPDLPVHLDRARQRAGSAVAEAGLVPPPLRKDMPFTFALRPMQAACNAVPLPPGRMLALIEDETGSGKTEAAIILAQRMLAAGKGSGLYVALPTMATADAMFARVASVLPSIFATPPSLVLAHGRAGLHDGYCSMAEDRARNPEEPGPTEWLADNRRRALLAGVGVGTMDQALLAVLKAKHAPLRQFGLSRKILIVDEVHEMVHKPFTVTIGTIFDLLRRLLRSPPLRG